MAFEFNAYDADKFISGVWFAIKGDTRLKNGTRREQRVS